MKIVFFGTGEFSTTILRGLIADNQNVVAVVTQPDKVNGRNNKVVYSQIKQYCLEQNIPIYAMAAFAASLNRVGRKAL